MSEQSAIRCKRCGTCCMANHIVRVTDEDRERWQREGREDILARVMNKSTIRPDDHPVNAKNGGHSPSCPFLTREGDRYACAIYETRPMVCRAYEPGSSMICPQFSR